MALMAAVCLMGGLLWVVGRTIAATSPLSPRRPNYERRLQILINDAANLIGLSRLRPSVNCSTG